MTREELKTHCEKQIRACEMWARSQGEKPCGKIYEEHKLILELLEQESVLDKIRTEIESCREDEEPHLCDYRYHRNEGLDMALDIIDKYRKGEDKE